MTLVTLCSARAWLLREGTWALLLVKIKFGTFSWPVQLGVANRLAVDGSLALTLVADA